MTKRIVAVLLVLNIFCVGAFASGAEAAQDGRAETGMISDIIGSYTAKPDIGGFLSELAGFLAEKIPEYLLPAAGSADRIAGFIAPLISGIRATQKTVKQIMSKLILPDHTIRIKLLGDSITHGVGGRGFEQDGDPIVEDFRRNPNGYCWANLFRDYMEEQYDCEVINNGCTATDIEFIIAHFDELVDPDDDIVICTIGTNNRHLYFDEGDKPTKREHMEEFYRNITLNDMFRDAGIDVIFCANIPAAPENELDGEDYWRIFHMNDVHDLYMKASVECGFPLISMYTAFMDYCYARDLRIDYLLCDDGLHPNNAGYEVMFHLMLRELGLAERLF